MTIHLCDRCEQPKKQPASRLLGITIEGGSGGLYFSVHRSYTRDALDLCPQCFLDDVVAAFPGFIERERAGAKPLHEKQTP